MTERKRRFSWYQYISISAVIVAITSIGLVKPGFTIRPGESEKLIFLGLLKADHPEELMTQVYERVSIRIGYESMYKESFSCEIPAR
jgi:hypothetical protein